MHAVGCMRPLLGVDDNMDVVARGVAVPILLSTLEMIETNIL